MLDHHHIKATRRPLPPRGPLQRAQETFVPPAVPPFLLAAAPHDRLLGGAIFCAGFVLQTAIYDAFYNVSKSVIVTVMNCI